MSEKITFRQFYKNSILDCFTCKNVYIGREKLDDIMKCLNKDLVRADYDKGFCKCQQYERDDVLDRFNLLYDSFPEDLPAELYREISNLLGKAQNLYMGQRANNK